MALFNLNLNTPVLQKYKGLIQNVYMITIIFLVFHILISLSNKNHKLDFGMSGVLFNCNLMSTLCMLLLAYGSYELVFKELVSIN
jgi:hypothetical protein